MLPHLRVHFKAHADDHITLLFPKVWTIPSPSSRGGGQRVIPILSELSFPSPSGKLSLYGVKHITFYALTSHGIVLLQGFLRYELVFITKDYSLVGREFSKKLYVASYGL